MSGLRVVEVAGFGPAPMAGMLLADHGADVIRVERPAGNDGPIEVEPRFFLHDRGKRRITLDLKQPEALAVLLDLIDRADVVIEGFRPGVAERIGFGPDACRARNPQLVYARVTGWGQTGPDAQRAGHDLNYIAAAGALGLIGPAGGAPSIPLNLIGDFGGGGLYAVFGILTALYERERSGLGQIVDVAMADGVLSLMASAFGYRAAGLQNDERGTNLLDGGAPHYNVYRTADGRFISIAPLEGHFLAALLEALGIDSDWVARRNDPAARPELHRLLGEAFATRTLADWMERLAQVDGCVAPVLTMAETEHHPQFVARDSVVRVDGVLQPGLAPRFERPAARVPSVALPGNGTDPILRELALNDNEIAHLRRIGAVR